MARSDIDQAFRDAARRAGRARAAAMADREGPPGESTSIEAETGDVDAAFAEASRRAARQRTTGDAADVGGAIEASDGAFSLLDQSLRPGDIVEVFTNAANGWVRGRFEVVDGRPCVFLNVWDPAGDADVDGLPPWVGEWGGPLPDGARCRFP